MAELRFDRVTKIFAPPYRAVNDVSLTVTSGQCLALVGPSGCGKTTFLRLIAGLDEPTSGQIDLDGHSLSSFPCWQRGVAMMFQRPIFMPGQSIRHNLRWGASLRRSWSETLLFRSMDSLDIDVESMADQLGLKKELDRPLHQLSGGQQQRVALGRCLLQRTKVWLLDEPLSHLDAPLRVGVRRLIRTLAQEKEVIVLYVTHDPMEALAVGDLVAVMHQGRILQSDEPLQLYQNPAHSMVVDLLNHDRGGMNYLKGQFGRHEMGYWFDGPLGRWILSPSNTPENVELVNFLHDAKNLLSKNDTIRIIIGIAAHDVACVTDPASCSGEIQIELTVNRQEFSTGHSWVLARDEQDQQWIGRASQKQRFQPGQGVMVTFSLQQTYGFDETTGRTLWAPIR